MRVEIQNVEVQTGTDASGGYGAVVDRAIGQIVEGPLDGGFGDTFDSAPLTARDEAVARAKDEVLDGLDVPEGCKVKFVHTVPYAGTEPLMTPVIQHPLNPAYATLPA